MPGIGTQLLVPTGYKSLSAEYIYHYLGRHGELADAMLCTFTPQKAFIEYISNSEFEHAVSVGKLVPPTHQAPLPYWFKPALDRAADPSDPFSFEAYKTRHEKAVDTRYERIKELLKQPNRIIAAESPFLLLGRHARNLGAHEDRLACDFLLALVFRTKWALLPLNFRKGAYEQKDDPSHKKRGPKHKARGSEYGWPVTEEMRQLMYQGYERYSRRSRSLREIWRKTLTKIFKCKTRRRQKQIDAGRAEGKAKKNSWEFYQPENNPFPTYDQFRNAVMKHFGIDRVRRDKLGEQRTRNSKRPSKGTFTESVSNINERIFADGYYLHEVPKGSKSDAAMKRMCTVRIRDTATGMPGGVGLSIGGETAEAYQMALFCMAIQKSRFGQLMGIDIDDHDWPIVGLPSWFSVDRGPGSKDDLLQDQAAEVAFVDIASSYAPQSKAVIESVNPKNTKTSGAPTYIESDLTYTRLAQREILRAVRDCERIDVSDRLTPEMKAAGVQGNPLAVFNYLDSSYRNDSRLILFEDAVRSFLRPIEVTITKNGAVYYGQKFDSLALRESRALDRAAGSGNFNVKGYVIPLCLRQVWIDINGTLVECQAQLALRDNPEQLNISLNELISLDEKQRAAARLAEESRYALDSEYEERFEDQTGSEWDGGTERHGRPNTGSVESRSEFADTKEVGTGGRR